MINFRMKQSPDKPARFFCPSKKSPGGGGGCMFRRSGALSFSPISHTHYGEQCWYVYFTSDSKRGAIKLDLASSALYTPEGTSKWYPVYKSSERSDLRRDPLTTAHFWAGLCHEERTNHPLRSSSAFWRVGRGPSHSFCQPSISLVKRGRIFPNFFLCFMAPNRPLLDSVLKSWRNAVSATFCREVSVQTRQSYVYLSC